MKKQIPILLIALGVVMIYLSFKASMLPPGLTGVGFILISIYMLINKQEDQ